MVNAIRGAWCLYADYPGNVPGISFSSIRRGRSSGGRVYTTALAAITLEVYYRYLPFYELRLEELARDTGRR